CLGMCDQAPAAFVQQAGESPVEMALGRVAAREAVVILSERSERRISSVRGDESQRFAQDDNKMVHDDNPYVEGITTETQTLRLPQGMGSGAPHKDRRLLRRIGIVDPASIDAYRASGGFEALRKALEIGPEAIIREVTE